MIDYVLVNTGTQVAGALVFVLLLRYFAESGGRKYLHLWAWSWLAFAAYVAFATTSRIAGGYWSPVDPRRILLSVLSVTTGLSQLVFLLAATYELSSRTCIERRRLVPWLAASAVLATVLTFAWINDPDGATLRYIARAGVRGVLAALAFGGAGLWFGSRHWNATRLGGRVFATAMVLYGCSQLAIALMGLSVSPALVLQDPNRLVVIQLDVMLQLLIGLGMMIWLLERERDERVVDWEKLAASEERYRTVAESASDAIITIDESSRVLFSNTGASRMFGYTVGELVGDSLMKLMPPESRGLHERGLHEHLRTGELHFSWAGARLTGRHKDGRDVPFEMSLSKYVHEGQVYFTGILRDLSDRLQLETQRQRSQRLEAIGQLAGGISHDFNNLLMAIGGNADLALMTLPSEHVSHRRVAEIRRITSRASELTKKLLAFSRQQPMELQLMDLNTAVEEFSSLMRRLIGEQITLDVGLSPEPLLILADTSLVDQVLLNLAVNARDAMPTGGVLSVSTSAVTIESVPDERRRDRRPGTFACLRVTDTGTGIAPQHLERIFDPFFTTKDVGKGTGLGLATAYGVMKQHGGWIEVDTEVGRGSTFAVFLERVWEQLPSTQRESTFAVSTGRERVLVVEDEREIREVMGEALTAAGYKVTEAADGPAALKAARAAHWAFDAVITDIVMPGGLNGFEVATELRGMIPEIRVIFISGYHEQTVPQGAPAHAYLSKPIGLMEMVRAVRRSLDTR